MSATNLRLLARQAEAEVKMNIFGPTASTNITWGPNVSADVSIAALGGIVNDSWFLVNLHAGAKEIVDVRQCFNDVSFIYALGNNQSQCAISLTFVVFLGGKNCKDEDGTANIQAGFQQYVKSRISQQTSAKEIGVGKFVRKGWLTGIEVGQVDMKKSVCYATVHFLMELKA